MNRVQLPITRNLQLIKAAVILHLLNAFLSNTASSPSPHLPKTHLCVLGSMCWSLIAHGPPPAYGEIKCLCPGSCWSQDLARPRILLVWKLHKADVFTPTVPGGWGRAVGWRQPESTGRLHGGAGSSCKASVETQAWEAPRAWPLLMLWSVLLSQGKG